MGIDSKVTDAELVQCCLAGDLNAFEELVKRYQGHVHGLAYDLTKDFEEARDLTQEAFIKAFQHLSELREPGKFAGWLRKLARNLCLDYLRTCKGKELLSLEELNEKVRRGSEPEIVDENPSPQEQVEREELRQQILEEVRNLEEHYRLPLTLYYLDGFSYQSIADFLGIRLQTVKWRLHKAKKLLRELICEKYPLSFPQMDKKEEVLPMVEETFESKKLPEEFSEQVLEQLLIRNYGMGYDSGVDYHGLSGMVHLSSEKPGRKLTLRTRRAAASAIKDTNPGCNVIDSGQEYNELLARMSLYASFKDALEHFKVKVEKVILREGEDGECYAEVSLRQQPYLTPRPPLQQMERGRTRERGSIESELALVRMRPSDGLSLAYRFKAPVFATDALMQRKVIPEGRKGKLTKEEVETLLYGKPLSDLLWTRLRDIALEKPLSLGSGRAEAHIRLVTEGSEKKAIVENSEKVEVPLTEEQYQGLMKFAADWDEKVNKRGWSSGETKGHWWFAHQVTIKPDETKLTFAGNLLPSEEIQEQYKKLIAECQEIVSLENKRSRLSEAYRDWAGYYLEAGDNEKALAILQEGLQELEDNAQICAMIEEVRRGTSLGQPASVSEEIVGIPKVSGRLEVPSTTWAGEIYVTGDVLIPAGATLTIESGTTIKFARRQDDANLFEEKEGEGYAYLTVTPLCSLIVEGTLIAEGTMAHPITFTSAATSPEPGDWYGIIFRNPASESKGNSPSNPPSPSKGEGRGEGGTGVVQHCRIEYAVRGISCYDKSPRISNNAIRNSALWGIFACGKNSNPVIAKNEVISTLFGIGAEGGSFSKCDAPAISDNMVRGARSAGIVATTDTSPLIKNNRLLENTEGIRCDWYATPKIRNNILVRNGTGILVIHASFPKIENNTIHGNRRFGIRIPDWEPEIKPKAGAPDAILIERNILSENKDAAIRCDKNVPCKVTSNNLYQNNIFVNALTQMEGNLSIEPLFVDALQDDFRLSPESPCLKASIGACEG